MVRQEKIRGAASLGLSRLLTLNYLPAFVAIVAMVGMLIYADWRHQQDTATAKRTAVSESLRPVRSKLEGNIGASMALIRGLVATLETEPEMTQQRFSTLAERVLAGRRDFISISAAPDFVVSMVYPYEQDSKVLGLDYNKTPVRRAAALLVRDTGQPIVTGPVKLVQGGEGLIAVFPVIIRLNDGSERFWGILSAVLDLKSLYHNSGLYAVDPDVDISMSVDTNDKASSRLFYGAKEVLGRDPVQMDVKIGYENWVISAAPKRGWDMSLWDIWRFRLLLLAGEFVIVLPMLWAGRLMEERQRNLRILNERDDQMKALSHRLQIALETSKIGVWEYDVANNHLFWDARMKTLYGVPAEKAAATRDDWKNAIHPDDLELADREFVEVVAGNGSYRSEFRVVGKSGNIRHIRAMGTVFTDSRGRKKIIGVNWDVTEDVRLQADLRAAKRRSDEQNQELEKARLKMETAALHDALTGLPNRRYLDQRIAELDVPGDDGSAITVLHIDLDRFKDINDTLGHAAGDLILRHAALTLQQNILPDDFLARIGGDEFVIISRSPNDVADHADMAARLIEAISRPIDYQGHECRVGASIGIASRSQPSERIDQLLIDADIALYEAKRRGRNRVENFSDSLRLSAVNTKKTADEILRGLEHNEFMAYFQPQFDAHTLEIVGVEALARWDHPTKGILTPDAFLHIAESLKVVAAIDDIILNQALLQHYRLEANGIAVPKMSVNVSAQRLRDEKLIDRLQKLNLRPGSLSFELLESTSFDGHDGELVPQIDKIRQLGIDIEIDDFGTGYASIVTLLKLTPRRLKIDRQLIAPIVDSLEQQRLVSSIIDIGRSRGIEIIAEGVETMAHAAILRDLGCHALQGYALARPLSPADLLTFARERRWLQAAALDKVV